MNLVPVEIDQKVYALDVSSLREILPTPPLTPVPFAPHWILGVAQIRGELVSVISLPDRLAEEVADREALLKAPHLIVLQGTPPLLLGALVQRVGPVRPVREDQLTPARHLCERGRVVLEDLAIGILDPDRLIQP